MPRHYITWPEKRDVIRQLLIASPKMLDTKEIAEAIGTPVGATSSALSKYYHKWNLIRDRKGSTYTYRVRGALRRERLEPGSEPDIPAPVESKQKVSEQIADLTLAISRVADAHNKVSDRVRGLEKIVNSLPRKRTWKTLWI